MKRKLFSAALALVLFISLVPAASATESTGKTVNLSKIDFESVTDTERLTKDSISESISGANLIDSDGAYADADNSEKIYLKVVDDPVAGGTHGKVLKIYNEVSTKPTASVDFAFANNYNSADGSILCWEMDYYFTGMEYNSNTVVPAHYSGWTIGNFNLQRNDKNNLRIKVNNVVAGSTMSPKPDVWTHLKVMFDVANDKILLVELDASGNVTTQTDIQAASLTDAFEKININLTNNPDTVDYYLDNIEVYTVNPIEIASSTPGDGSENVLTEKDIEIKLTNAIADDSELVVSVSADGGNVSADSYTYSVSEDKKTVTVSFNGGMEYASSYAVTLSGAKDEYGLPLNDTISFKTEAAPDISVEESSWVDGNVGAISFSGAKSAAVTLKNNTADDKDVLLVFASYSNQEPKRLIDTQYVSLSLSGNETAEIIQGLVLSEGVGSVKVFVWNTLSRLNPQSAPISSEIQ